MAAGGGAKCALGSKIVIITTARWKNAASGWGCSACQIDVDHLLIPSDALISSIFAFRFVKTDI